MGHEGDRVDVWDVDGRPRRGDGGARVVGAHRRPARRGIRQREDDRPGNVLGELAFDLPDQLLASRFVGILRLPYYQFVDLGIAIAVPIEARSASVEQIEDRVGIRPAGLQVEADGEFLAHDLRDVARGVDQLELAIEIDLLQLVDQDHRRVAIHWQVARRDLDRQPMVRPVAEFFHDLAGFRAVLLHIGIVAGQCLQEVQRHPP